MRRLIPILAAAVAGSALTAAALALRADAAPDEGGRSERERQWQQCMREAGFDLDGDVVVRVTPDGVTVNGEEVDPEAFREAERRCGRPFDFPRPEPEDLLPDLERPFPFGLVPRRERMPDFERAPFPFVPPRFDDMPDRDRLPEAIPPRLREELDRLERLEDCLEPGLAPNET